MYTTYKTVLSSEGPTSSCIDLKKKHLMFRGNKIGEKRKKHRYDDY